MDDECALCSLVVRQALVRAGIKEADSVLVAGLRHLNPADGDAFITASVIQVQTLRLDVTSIHHASCISPCPFICVENALGEWADAPPPERL